MTELSEKPFDNLDFDLYDDVFDAEPPKKIRKCDESEKSKVKFC